MRFNGEMSHVISTPTGIPQGSPLSPLLYMYYNADLLDYVDPESRETMTSGFIDDIVYGVAGESDGENANKLNKLLEKAEEWRAKHGAQFERSKYVLVHFTRNYRKSTSAKVSVNSTTIAPSSEARYLGVIFDQQLRFHSHLQQAAKRGTSAAFALGSIARTNWGAPFRYVKQLYQTVVIPRIDYGATIWHRPKDYKGYTACPSQISKLSTVQRLAAKAILGCYRTTATIAMEKEAGLLPTWIRLQQLTLLSAVRLKSLSIHHPIQEWLHRASLTRTAVVPHRSVLGNLLNQFEILTEESEHIEPFIRPPWWAPKFTVQVALTKELAKTSHNETQATSNPDTMHIYTNGSNIDGKVGAAAYNATTLTTSQQHLGSETSFNVFAAEVEAVNLALKQWQLNSHSCHPRCHLYSDSQAGCTAILQPKRQSGQSIIKEVLDRIDTIHRRHPNWQLAILWVPGHQGIDGNELADAAAKQAARISPSSHRDRYPHNRLKSSLQQAISSITKTKWDNYWSQNTSASHLRRILSKPSSKPEPKLYNSITTRASCTTLAQLRTGHCGLNKYLHRFKLANSAFCECGYGKETVEHFLLECRRYKEDRKLLRKNVGWRKMKVEKLLGSTKVFKHTMEFVKSTGRLIN